MQSALASKTAISGNVHAFQGRRASSGASGRGQLQVGNVVHYVSGLIKVIFVDIGADREAIEEYSCCVEESARRRLNSTRVRRPSRLRLWVHREDVILISYN